MMAEINYLSIALFRIWNLLLLSWWSTWKGCYRSFAHSVPLLQFKRIILIFLIISSYFYYLSNFLASPAFLLHSCILFIILIIIGIWNFVQTCVLYNMILNFIDGFILREYFSSFQIFIAHYMRLLYWIIMLAWYYIIDLKFI